MVKNKYKELKDKHQEEINKFPMAFAFSDKQFAEGMKKLGLSPADTDKIYAIPGTNGFYKRTDAEALHDMLDKHAKEMKQALDSDKIGDGFILDMFNYELANHEYSYTHEVDETLSALDLTKEEVCNSPKLLYGLQKACEFQNKL